MLQEERMTMLELRHSPWCEGLDCVDSLEEPLPGGALEGEEDLEGAQQEGSDPLEDTISSSLLLVLPSDFAPSRVNSKAQSSHVLALAHAAMALALSNLFACQCAPKPATTLLLTARMEVWKRMQHVGYSLSLLFGLNLS